MPFTLLTFLICFYFHAPVGWWIFIVWAVEFFFVGRAIWRRW